MIEPALTLGPGAEGGGETYSEQLTAAGRRRLRHQMAVLGERLPREGDTEAEAVCLHGQRGIFLKPAY